MPLEAVQSPPQIEVGGDPQVPLAEVDEDGDCDTLGVSQYNCIYFMHHVLNLLEQGSYFKNIRLIV